jgi:hypothetical protein
MPPHRRTWGVHDSRARCAGSQDPDAPKRGRTSYIVFSDLHRPAIAAKNPKMKMTDLSVKLGAMWKKVSAAEKLKCEAIVSSVWPAPPDLFRGDRVHVVAGD